MENKNCKGTGRQFWERYSHFRFYLLMHIYNNETVLTSYESQNECLRSIFNVVDWSWGDWSGLTSRNAVLLPMSGDTSFTGFSQSEAAPPVGKTHVFFIMFTHNCGSI